MAKGISKEQIIGVTLALIKDKENIRSVNLREIARHLGCAHTNLYNYYEDLDAILWDVMDEVLHKSLENLSEGIEKIDDDNIKLDNFYRRFVEFYIDNRGWFVLCWFEKLSGSRPQKNYDLTVKTVDYFADIVADVFHRMDGIKLIPKESKYILHNVHCYLHGEVSIFLAGRGLIKEETEFKNYVVDVCVKMTKLFVNSLKQGG